ncbi:MAG: hypothetical protein Q9Q13_05985, partial [Acidobacteriota bacterium]|nr:hypothetical protein [Acidobacteriota bacterium]
PGTGQTPSGLARTSKRARSTWKQKLFLAVGPHAQRHALEAVPMGVSEAAQIGSSASANETKFVALFLIFTDDDALEVCV